MSSLPVASAQLRSKARPPDNSRRAWLEPHEAAFILEKSVSDVRRKIKSGELHDTRGVGAPHSSFCSVSSVRRPRSPRPLSSLRRLSSCDRVGERLSHKPNRLYKSDNGQFR